MITLDFAKSYTPITMTEDYTAMTFNSPQVNGSLVLILVQLQFYPISKLPNVYNLGFGPSDGNGSFLDNVTLQHLNLNKVFSCIMLLPLAFLKLNPNYTIGLDGSNDARARIYHMMFRSNIAQLGPYLATIGLDYYVKQLRNGNLETDSIQEYLYTPIPEAFDYERSSRNLYRYYMFYRK